VRPDARCRLRHRQEPLLDQPAVSVLEHLSKRCSTIPKFAHCSIGAAQRIYGKQAHGLGRDPWLAAG
jgi:hypothetical protein